MLIGIQTFLEMTTAFSLKISCQCWTGWSPQITYSVVKEIRVETRDCPSHTDLG